MRPPSTSNKLHWLLCLLAVGVAAASVFGIWRSWPPSQKPGPRPSAEQTVPLPPYSESRYLNTGPDAHYVGTASCAGCHGSKHDSYLLTAHSRSLKELSPLNLQDEPPDDSFRHDKSGHSYRVYRQDGQLHHEESLRKAAGEEIARLDLPVRYLIGSGSFSRSYLVEVNGFLQESPITWYASKKTGENQKPGAWGMSPGYDTQKPPGFERQIALGCLACHTGRTDPTDADLRLTIHEQAIGCESCHGRGSLHVALQKANKAEPGVPDLTIVNPGKLSRPYLESLCGNCHLNGPARVTVRGRAETAFRPGMPVTDYHIDYRFDSGNEQMTVVGHLEQLRRSACYQKSKDLSCLTCHDPHAKEKPKDPAAFYRDQCLKCHSTDSCKKLDHAQRLKNDGIDNCVTCHLPRSNTDIPHIAFTHHRIGIYPAKPTPSDHERVPALVPAEDDSSLPELDRKRNLGLAYLDVVRMGEYPKYADVYESRARELLEAVYAAGLRDAETVESLADLYKQKDPARCKQYARQVLDRNDSPPLVRAYAMSFWAAAEAKDHNYTSAIDLLNKLVRLRQTSEDWKLLGGCHLWLHRPLAASSALEQALALRPDSAEIHELLASAYNQLKDAQRSRAHKEKADWLRLHGSP